MFVHREEYYQTDTTKSGPRWRGQADLIIAKQRNGPIGDVKLAWLEEFTRFRDSRSAAATTNSSNSTPPRRSDSRHAG